MIDFYKILGLESSCSQEEIKKAYRKLSFKFHPDKNDGDLFFENMFKQIQQAYEILGNPEKRKSYDNEYLSRRNEKTAFNYPQPPIIDFFEIDKEQIKAGENINLEWSTKNADYVEIDLIGSVKSKDKISLNIGINEIGIKPIKITAVNNLSGLQVSKMVKLNILPNNIYKEILNSLESEQKKNKVSIFSTKGSQGRKEFISFVFLSLINIFLFTILLDIGFLKWFVYSFLGILLFIQGIKRLNDLKIKQLAILLIFIPILNILFIVYLMFAKGGKSRR